LSIFVNEIKSLCVVLLFKYRVGYNVKKLFQEKDVYKDRDSQIEAIEGTFKAAKKPVRITAILLEQ
jgi:hypothetical protein